MMFDKLIWKNDGYSRVEYSLTELVYMSAGGGPC
jgi:hypothetical protein